MNATQSKTSIPPRGLPGALAGIELLDVRTPAEYEAAHVEGAKLLPLDQLDASAYLSQRKSDGPIYLLCHSGSRAAKAAEKFKQAGFDGCVVVEGGTEACIAAGLPVIRGSRNVLPLMRQVQIAIGTIVATGSLLTLLADSKFALIPLFMGCGLIFAGVTGFCGLAVLIAKMPWNQKSGCGAASCCAENYKP
jgi:rhodanese-related sulfurtransferase